MRKKFLYLTMLLGLCFYSGCDNQKEYDNQKEVILKKGNLIISEFIQNSSNSVLELYNCSNDAIQLKDYRIKLDFNQPQYIDLTGSLSAHETYIIAYNSNYLSEEIKEKADLLTDKLFFSGEVAIMVQKKNTLIDILGMEGESFEYCKNKGIIRKERALHPQTEFDEYDWIRYPKETLSNLGNVDNLVSEDELLTGPKLTEEDYSRPFINPENNTLGGGGVIEVSVSSYGDGDTTTFNLPETLGLGSTMRVRYQNVDTRETMTNMTQEWGVPAKNFTNNALKNATKIELQSVYHAPLFETFGRMLAWVWIDGVLQNFMLVKEGYSEIAFAESASSYQGILYTDYLYHVELYAKRNHLKIHGEKDPTWDYDTNKPKE